MAARSGIEAAADTEPARQQMTRLCPREDPRHRTKARKVFTLDDHAKATEGVECRKDAEVIDETPGAYKDIGAVMRAQRALTRIVRTLRPVLCFKGA